MIFSFCMIVEGNGAHHLSQIAIFREFIIFNSRVYEFSGACRGTKYFLLILSGYETFTTFLQGFQIISGNFWLKNLDLCKVYRFFPLLKNSNQIFLWQMIKCLTCHWQHGCPMEAVTQETILNIIMCSDLRLPSFTAMNVLIVL